MNIYSVDRELVRRIIDSPRSKEQMLKMLMSLPSAQLEQKVSARKGRWIKHNTGHSVYFDCSLCGCLAPCTETEDKFIWKLSNYCPDCGADMRGGEEDKS